MARGTKVAASPELATLYQVQQADTEIARLKQALSGLDDGSALAAEIAAEEAELKRLLDRHQTTENESLDRDLELKALEEKRRKFSDQLYGGSVHNPRQLADLQGEVEMLSREIGKVEDRILELMEALEQERAEIAQREQRLEEQRGELAQIREKHRVASARLRQELTELEERRRGLAAQVPAALLKRYEQIRARQSNLGLVKVTGDTCPGCRITLPSETLKALRSQPGPLTCENRGRLLFWDESIP